ncbi:hypothetical protein [Streptomyces chumphonensis]|uniref:hypothetical protein n=1 Tax=Streptomyces chumphonensis TaxID=1214925 RepID=UPI003D7094D2
MTKDVQTAWPGRAPGARPLPDLADVTLAALADLTDPYLSARVDALLRDPEVLTEVWCGGGTDSEVSPSSTGLRRASRER